MDLDAIDNEDQEFSLRESCGVYGAILFNSGINSEATTAGASYRNTSSMLDLLVLGMTALQHRGQESAGLVVSDGGPKICVQRGMGLVAQAFTPERLASLLGADKPVWRLGLGHTRYSTLGASESINCQPFVVETTCGQFAVAHNGELVNANRLKSEILQAGIGLSTDTDSELITQMLCTRSPSQCWTERITYFMSKCSTSYSLLILTGDSIYAVRDPFGNRPLCLGEILCGDEVIGYAVSSESCAFQSTSTRLLREVQPGEIVRLSIQQQPELSGAASTIETCAIVPRPSASSSSNATGASESTAVLPAMCIFEYVYFARPDSQFEGQQVYSVRRRCGAQLASESPCSVDLVSTVPESATPAAMGYASACGLPYVEVFCKNRYIGRTFIQPSNLLRQVGVAKKFGVIEENVRDKRIVLIDDSIVRGNTMGPIVSLLRSHGASEVHIRIASPPLRHPCYMGINIPTKEELIANKLTLEQLRRALNADSLAYLSVEGLHKAVSAGCTSNPIGHCDACLTGKYPVQLDW
uniref:Amidophosphoribosyltransferase n=2 Tax=Macrostomum lignano TaxID=282301 RepID=A0A1I8HWH7_9PLAT